MSPRAGLRRKLKSKTGLKTDAEVLLRNLTEYAVRFTFQEDAQPSLRSTKRQWSLAPSVTPPFAKLSFDRQSEFEPQDQYPEKRTVNPGDRAHVTISTVRKTRMTAEYQPTAGAKWCPTNIDGKLLSSNLACFEFKDKHVPLEACSDSFSEPIVSPVEVTPTIDDEEVTSFEEEFGWPEEKEGDVADTDNDDDDDDDNNVVNADGGAGGGDDDHDNDHHDHEHDVADWTRKAIGDVASETERSSFVAVHGSGDLIPGFFVLWRHRKNWLFALVSSVQPDSVTIDIKKKGPQTTTFTILCTEYSNSLLCQRRKDHQPR